MPILRTSPSVLSALKEQVSSLGVPLSSQVEALRELFEIFTTRRSSLPHLNYLDIPRYRLAYMRYHLPLNVARSTCILTELLARHPELSEYESIVDLGSGPGSSSLATLLTLSPNPARKFFLTDRSRRALQLARKLMENCASREGIELPQVTHRVQRLPQLPSIPPRSLVWLSMVLNEIPLRKRRGFDLESFLRRLETIMKPPGILVIVEPGLRGPGLDLLKLHNLIVTTRRWRVVAPCTHQKTCPLLREKNRPWCHFHFNWQPGDFVKEVARPLNINCAKSSFSYLVIQRSRGEGDDTTSRDLARVIGDPMNVRGGRRGIYVCRDGKRETLTRMPHQIQRGDRILQARGRRPTQVETPWRGGKGD